MQGTWPEAMHTQLLELARRGKETALQRLKRQDFFFFTKIKSQSKPAKDAINGYIKKCSFISET